MTTSPKPHFSPPGSPLPKRPQTALAMAFRKSPIPLKLSSSSSPLKSKCLLKRAVPEPLESETGKLTSPFLGQQGDVLAWQPNPPPEPQKGFVCYYCQREFPDALLLTRHSRSHGAAAPYSCSVCGKMFPLYSSLMIHEKSHAAAYAAAAVERSPAATATSSPLPYPYRMCGSLFLNQASLKAHERRHIMTKESRVRSGGWVTGDGGGSGGCSETRPYYECALCGERVSNEALLRIHMQRHKRFPAPRVCTLCGTTFSCDAFLRAHARLHEAEPTLRCVICVRPFRRSRMVLRHSDLVHAAEDRRNVCDACQRRFPKIASSPDGGARRRMRWLEEDEEDEEGEGEWEGGRRRKKKQFTCLYCGVGFSRLHQLAAHEASHRELPSPVAGGGGGVTPGGKAQLHLPTVVVN